MYYKLIWFITNILFVVSLVSTLFLHRAVTTEKMQNNAQQSYSRLRKLITFRRLLVVSTVLFFITMCASFLADMRING